MLCIHKKYYYHVTVLFFYVYVYTHNNNNFVLTILPKLKYTIMTQINNSAIIVLFISTFLSPSALSAQTALSAHAGNDFHVCFGAYSELNASAEGGTPPYKFQWTTNEDIVSPDEASTVVTPSFSRSYSVVVTDANGKTATDFVKADVIDRPMLNPMGTLTVEAGQIITLEPNVIGNPADYTYSWRPTTGLDNPNSKNPTAKATNITYTVLVKGKKGCTATEQVTITVETENTTNTKKSR
jgi:hypothetical protein